MNPVGKVRIERTSELNGRSCQNSMSRAGGRCLPVSGQSLEDACQPASYPLLRRIVIGLNDSAHQTRPGSSAPGRIFRDPLLRTFHGLIPFCFSQQGVALQRRPHLNWSEHDRQVGWRANSRPLDLHAARYDIITAGENWARFETSGVAAACRLTQEREITPISLGFSRHGNLGHI